MKRVKSPRRLQRDHYLRMAEVFRGAQHDLQIAGGSSGWRFICLAIGYLDASRYGYAQRMAAKAIVMERIAPYSTVEQWLECNVPGVHRDAKNIPFETLQDYRVRWLKSLAAEFANKGLK
jgi:hypothetical protein